MLDTVSRCITLILAWPFAAWLFISFDTLRGIPLNSIDIRAEQAMVTWPSIVFGLLLGGAKAPFWRFTLTSGAAGFVLYIIASMRLHVINPAMALLIMLAVGTTVCLFRKESK